LYFSQSNIKNDQRIIITADGDRLVQMYSNILDNCLKYSTKPGILTVRQQLFQNHICLSFEDSGPGVPGDALPRLFDRLYRVDPSRSRIPGGSGLGLSICKNIAETLNGRITARNIMDGGLGIDIELPLQLRENGHLS
jgi:two-component system sensor histidine kinase BaeS